MISIFGIQWSTWFEMSLKMPGYPIEDNEAKLSPV